MGFIRDYNDKKIRRTCVRLYEKVKKQRPNKSKRDYLKIILLTKVPFDYQHDKVIDFILDEEAKDIEELSDFIIEHGRDKDWWERRERNLKCLDSKIVGKKYSIKERNIEFFKEFWSG